MLKNLDHPNIVKLQDIVLEGKGWIQDKNAKFMLALDYYPHDFSGIINDKDVRLNQAQIKSYIQQLLRAIAYIHSQGVMHRDLKTSNILLSLDGDVKLADFGLSCFLKTLSEDEDYQTLVVTRWYRSPELLLGDSRYNYAIDMWSVGCILAEFMQGTALFKGQDSRDQLKLIFEMCGTPELNGWEDASKLRHWSDWKPQTQRANHLDKHFERFVDNPVLDLLSQMLCLNPKKRITAAQALDHPWFAIQPLPNKSSGRLPDVARNELWIKNKTAQQVYPLQPQHRPSNKRAHELPVQHGNARGNAQITNSFVAQHNEAVHGSEPQRKLRRFNAPDTNQNHYRSAPTSSGINPPIRPTVGRPSGQGSNG